MPYLSPDSCYGCPMLSPCWLGPSASTLVALAVSQITQFDKLQVTCDVCNADHCNADY